MTVLEYALVRYVRILKEAAKKRKLTASEREFLQRIDSQIRLLADKEWPKRA